MPQVMQDMQTQRMKIHPCKREKEIERIIIPTANTLQFAIRTHTLLHRVSNSEKEKREEAHQVKQLTVERDKLQNTHSRCVIMSHESRGHVATPKP